MDWLTVLKRWDAALSQSSEGLCLEDGRELKISSVYHSKELFPTATICQVLERSQQSHQDSALRKACFSRPWMPVTKPKKDRAVSGPPCAQKVRSAKQQRSSKDHSNLLLLTRMTVDSEKNQGKKFWDDNYHHLTMCWRCTPAALGSVKGNQSGAVD